MLVVISPAKKLDMEPMPSIAATVPDFAADTASLVRTARNLPIKALEQLMDISKPLAKLNAERFRDFDAQDEKPAAIAFAGDTYQGLEAGTLDADGLAWAQDHLRILSGLYGLLRPLDAIRPYRLEMGSRLKTRRGASLYDFWGAKLAKALNVQASVLGADVLVNCASQEYFGAVDRKALKLRVITPVFLEERNGQAKTVSFFAKRARGAMARFVVQNRLVDPEAIKSFDSGGYEWNAELSQGDTWVFRRPYPEAAASGGT